MLERYVPDTYVLAMSIDFFKTAYLRRIKPKKLADTTDGTRVALVGELTLEVKNKLAVGVLASA